MRAKTKIYPHREEKTFNLTSKSWALEETGNLNVKLCGMSERRRENRVQGERERKKNRETGRGGEGRIAIKEEQKG
jgi:hypothetical protein